LIGNDEKAFDAKHSMTLVPLLLSFIAYGQTCDELPTNG
jgi:hypothetical protein